MEGNESVLTSYYHHHHPTTNGMITNNQNQNQHIHVSTPHYTSSEPSTTTLSIQLVPSSNPPTPETVKKRRGRPRKYATPPPYSANNNNQLTSPPAKSQSALGLSEFLLELLDTGNAGQGFTPHIITVATDEDVAQNIMSFVQQRKCAVCILSASGSISNPSLRQPAMLGGNVTYEGCFEIFSLSGSFLHNEVGGASSRTGGLSVCLSSTDGRVVGGGVGGPLTAAGPVQIVAASFSFDTTKNTNADEKLEASLNKSPSQVAGRPSMTGLNFRPAPDSSRRISVRKIDNHQNFVGSFMLQPRGMDVTSPHSSDWRGGLGARDHGVWPSPGDGDDEQHKC
ncbi:hypothetical protein IFM89_023196 [Coptis chinensis]|uniref:AT-hook motif nuclear-localized protein n=1 Tax=Coptis chinensis TaxID=261450 RepID=A0A835LS55_9MAGN|nr:hypothetical protein IFM89_023196 [Coptis chinensis]